MLEQKDLETISEIVSKSLESLKQEVREIGLTLENELRRLKDRIDAIA